MQVLWVGGHALVRDLARAALAPAGVCVTSAASLPEALDVVDGLELPGVAVVDDDGRDEGRLVDAIRAIGRKRRQVPMLVLSSSRAPLLPATLLDAGATGYLGMDTPLGELVDAMERVAAGAVVLDPVAARNLMGSEWQRRADPVRLNPLSSARLRPPHITPIERSILLLAADGLMTKQIALRLGISPLTVKNHLARLRLRFGATDKAHVVATALRLGLLD